MSADPFIGVPYNFAESFREWSRVPVDDFGYMEAQELLNLHPLQLTELVKTAMAVRWNALGWRNQGGKLLAFMDPEAYRDRIVMDFGCGLGHDCLQFLKAGAHVVMADIHPLLLYLAQRVINVYTWHQKSVARLVIVSPYPPYIPATNFDLFWSFGVLHHFPYADQILYRACELLRPGGECKVVMYSDRRWEKMCKCPVPEEPTWAHPKFRHFVENCDAVGHYADWYNEEKLKDMVKDFADVTSCQYISNDELIAAVIRPKGKGEEE